MYKDPLIVFNGNNHARKVNQKRVILFGFDLEGNPSYNLFETN